MKKQVVKRDFNFPDSELMQNSDNMVNLLERDSAEFLDRGVTPAKVTQFIAARDSFANCPSDEKLEGIKQTKTETKNYARAALEQLMRSALIMARNVFGEGTGKYKEFGESDITSLSDDQLVRNAKLLIDAAQKYLADLGAEGMTSDKITSLTQSRLDLDLAIDAQLKAINERDVITEDRIEKANALYALLVKHSESGRDIWYSKSEAKYNDYVIHVTPEIGPAEGPTSV